MDDYYSDNQPDLIHCEYCGRDYAPDAADRGACPFCHTTPAGKKVRSTTQKQSSRGRSNSRGGGYGGARSPLSIIGIALSVILIIAAVIIVFVLAKNAISSRIVKDPNASADEISSQQDDDALQGGESSGSADTDQQQQPPVQVTSADSITLSETELNLSEGGTATLTATVTPADYSGNVLWKTSDGAVATVDQTGAVTYVGGGTCTITASAGETKAECTVTCEAPDGTGDLAVLAYGSEKDDVTLTVGEVVPFEAQGGDGSYTWSVANTSIATVTEEGKLTAVAAGMTTMTVRSGAYSIDVTIRVK